MSYLQDSSHGMDDAENGAGTAADKRVLRLTPSLANSRSLNLREGAVSPVVVAVMISAVVTCLAGVYCCYMWHAQELFEVLEEQKRTLLELQSIESRARDTERQLLVLQQLLQPHLQRQLQQRQQQRQENVFPLDLQQQYVATEESNYLDYGDLVLNKTDGPANEEEEISVKEEGEQERPGADKQVKELLEQSLVGSFVGNFRERRDVRAKAGEQQRVEGAENGMLNVGVAERREGKSLKDAWRDGIDERQMVEEGSGGWKSGKVGGVRNRIREDREKTLSQKWREMVKKWRRADEKYNMRMGKTGADENLPISERHHNGFQRKRLSRSARADKGSDVEQKKNRKNDDTEPPQKNKNKHVNGQKKPVEGLAMSSPAAMHLELDLSNPTVQQRSGLTRNGSVTANGGAYMVIGNNTVFIPDEESGVIMNWRPTNWSSGDEIFKYDLSRGSVTITNSGLYFVYAQVQFYHERIAGFEVVRLEGDGRANDVILKCLHGSSSSPEGRWIYSTCYVGAVASLAANDQLLLRDIYGGQPSGPINKRGIKVGDKSGVNYWGIFRLCSGGVSGGERGRDGKVGGKGKPGGGSEAGKRRGGR